MERRRGATGRAPLTRIGRPGRAALGLALVWLATVAGGGEFKLGGLLPLDAGRSASWCWSGTFRFPVGDPLELGGPGPNGEPGFRVNRNIGEVGGHQGADLDNRRGGDPVRAAAHGLVVVADGHGLNGGYGSLVVIAHRLMDETLAYSVYAHFARGTLRVRAGEAVSAGQVLGRIGSSGRATTEHLHFEIRRPDHGDARWEHARFVDPIAFITARLPAEDDSSWARPYLAWAEDAGLVLAHARAGETMDRARWWTMLARAARHDLPRLPDDPAGLCPALIAARVLAEETSCKPAAVVGWDELRRDLDRLRETGARLPPIAIERGRHRDARARALEPPAPKGGRGAAPRPAPTLAQACVLLADAMGEPGARGAEGIRPASGAPARRP